MSKTKKNTVNQKTLTDWIFKTYEIDYLPKHFYVQIAQVNKGTYRGLNKPVPIPDLLDMWQRKFSYLEKVYLQNKCKGKNIEGMARIYYDLSIILSKYDSYLKWKAEKEAEAIRREEESKQPKIDYEAIYQQIEDSRANKLESKKEEVDIAQLIDEMWVEHD